MNISIAMATYNGEKYLQKQLDSFVNQTHQPYELVICDDGSSDRTIEILQKFKACTPFKVRIYENEENLGFAKNFEKALALCSGDIIFLSDQDDVWLPKKLERVRDEFLARPDIQLIINDGQIVHDDLRDTGLTILGQTRSVGLGDRAFLSGCCSALRSEFRDIVLPVPDCVFVHDTWLHALGNSLNVRLVVDTPLQLYRRHGTNVSNALHSATTRLGRKDLLQSYSGGDSRGYAEQSLQKIDILRTHLQECREQSNGLTDRHFDLALCRLGAWESAARARLDLLARRRMARIAPASAMYLRGQYAHFSGWLSLAKDLVKP
jgi:glycosyltransferase involved in cell wall biosynthesis